MLEIVDREGNPLGFAKRAVVHANPGLLHRVVHVLVFNNRGSLLLQRRSCNKDIAPGKWDTSAGGHMKPGEDARDAALRELHEELGIISFNPEFLYAYIFSSSYESEFVTTFLCRCDGDVSFNPAEIDEVAYWTLESIKNNLGTSTFSDHFESEIRHFLQLNKN